MLIENEYFKLFKEQTDIIIYLKKLGYPLKEFTQIMQEYPRLKLHSFSTLQKALTAVEKETMIGVWQPLIELTVSKDKLEVHAVIRSTAEGIQREKNELIAQLNEKLDELGVVFGRKSVDEWINEKAQPVLVASGRVPVRGTDAKITYIERPARKPVIREDGSANYYEMNFVYSIEEGQWLGEKIDAQLGEDGVDVFGQLVPAPIGKNLELRYDEQSVYAEEEEEEGKTILRAKNSGTLEYINNRIRINQLLVVQEDVGPETGDINFAGAIKILGTIRAGYSVQAEGDISIEGKEGVTNAKMIRSTGGDIYIKGGVFGHHETLIEANGNIFLKHANNCTLIGKKLHIGLYLLGSEVTANEVYVEQNDGKIIGGVTEALFKVKCAVVGNAHERKTVIRVKGIDRGKHEKNVQQLSAELKENYTLMNKIIEYQTLVTQTSVKLSYDDRLRLEKMEDSLEKIEDEMTRINKEVQYSLAMLKVKEKPEVHIQNSVFPGTIIEVGPTTYRIDRETKGVFTTKQPSLAEEVPK